MREITDHHDGHGLTESITLRADDIDPNAGGASHYYTANMEIADNASIIDCLSVQFQHGPRNVPGSAPGVVESVLLAILIDRMRCFQAGPFGCRENALVMTHCQEALHWLKHRADARAKRGVLGKNEK